MSTETIEQKTYRIFKMLLNEPQSKEDYQLHLNSPSFKFYCKMINLAIVEERKYNAAVYQVLREMFDSGDISEDVENIGFMVIVDDCKLWDKGSEALADLEARAALKDEVSE